MAVLRDFCNMYQSRKSRSVQSSPSHTPALQQPRLRNIERRFLSEESRGSKQFRTYSTSDKRLGVLNEDQTIPKDFPRYTRLPAIGNFSEESPIMPKIVRQLTYTVIDPVYVRGPAAQPVKAHLFESNRISPKPLSKKKRLLPNRRRTQDDIAKELEERKKRVQERFSKSVHTGRIQVSEELIDTSEQLQKGRLQTGKNAFWIEF